MGARLDIAILARRGEVEGHRNGAAGELRRLRNKEGSHADDLARLVAMYDAMLGVIEAHAKVREDA